MKKTRWLITVLKWSICSWAFCLLAALLVSSGVAQDGGEGMVTDEDLQYLQDLLNEPIPDFDPDSVPDMPEEDLRMGLERLNNFAKTGEMPDGDWEGQEGDIYLPPELLAVPAENRSLNPMYFIDIAGGHVSGSYREATLEEARKNAANAPKFVGSVVYNPEWYDRNSANGELTPCAITSVELAQAEANVQLWKFYLRDIEIAEANFQAHFMWIKQKEGREPIPMPQ